MEPTNIRVIEEKPVIDLFEDPKTLYDAPSSAFFEASCSGDIEEESSLKVGQEVVVRAEDPFEETSAKFLAAVERFATVVSINHEIPKDMPNKENIKNLINIKFKVK